MTKRKRYIQLIEVTVEDLEDDHVYLNFTDQCVYSVPPRCRLTLPEEDRLINDESVIRRALRA